ncbi:MAG: hypothetical protein HFI37_08000 [Lachnospiraceae bacterium]|nr:hypothetical protein [Lachnospiraceae bacterium]
MDTIGEINVYIKDKQPVKVEETTFAELGMGKAIKSNQTLSELRAGYMEKNDVR